VNTRYFNTCHPLESTITQENNWILLFLQNAHFQNDNEAFLKVSSLYNQLSRGRREYKLFQILHP
jgi:hypothetical protein